MTLRLLLSLLVGLAIHRALAEVPPIASVLQPFVESHSLAGAVTLVATKDKVLSVETVGFADIAAKKPMQPNTMFWIASMSKAMTAAAVMILVDEGKVKIDDPVEKYLPEFKELWVSAEQDKDRVLLRRPAHAITVREVLSHTSGLPFKSGIEQPSLDQIPLRVAALSHAMMPLLFEPGTQYKYSNAGINTAGRILEVVSGMSYEDFMQQRLFDPLGMKDTTFWPNDEQVARLAKSYKPNEGKNDLVETPIGQLTYPLSERSRQPMPGGGLFSTASDTAKFCQMLLNRGTAGDRRILSEDAVNTMTSRQTAGTIKENYGFGLTIAGSTYGHGGAHATNMTVDTDPGLVTVFMVQHTGGFPGNGKESLGAFKKAAAEKYGKRATAAPSGPTSGAVKMLASVEREGRGNEAASAAWKEVAKAGPTALPALLAAAGKGSPVADNWLRLAGDAIVDTAVRAKQPLPVAEIEMFLRDTNHAAAARQLAFDLLRQADAARADAVEPSLIADPVQELRRGAVQRVIDAAKAKSGDDAKATFQKALDAVRDEDQTKVIAAALKDLGVPVDLPRHFGFLMKWNVIGPFENAERKGFETVFPPETELRLDAEYDGKGAKVKWQPFESADEYGKLDFNKPLGMQKEVTAYATATFDSPTERDAELRLGCKNAWKVWLNGELLFGRDEYHRGQQMDQYKLKCRLKKGANTVLVKACQNEQKEQWTVEWEFQLRVCDSTGTAILAASK